MKKLGKLISSILVVSMCAALFTGCGKRGEPVQTTGAAALGDAVDINKDSLKVAAAVASMDTNTTVWIDGMKTALVNYPNIELQIFNANGSAETQSQQIQEIINQNFNGMILNAVDTSACAALTTEAENAGVNVIHMNFGPDTPHSGGITNDSYSLGVLVAKDAYEKTGGNAKCVAIGPPVAMSSTVLGVNGFEDTLKEDSGMEFLESQAGDWSTEKGNSLMRDLLSKYKNDIQVVFCHNDQMAIGAAQAIDAAGLTGKILVYGVDGTADGIQYIKDGKMEGSAAVDNKKLGETAMQLTLYAMGTGISGSSLAETPVIKETANIIDKDNVSDYE